MGKYIFLLSDSGHLTHNTDVFERSSRSPIDKLSANGDLVETIDVFACRAIEKTFC